ncbi:MAG: integrase core domain-containing protein [Planctomycetota bacterium]|jgi:transposase InsO family protein
MSRGDDDSATQRWGRLRFSIVGPLLAAPPRRGALQTALRRLAAKTWTHPTTGEPVCFGFSTIERWYYQCRDELRDPIGMLRRKVRTDAGTQPSLSAAVRQALHAQYREHSRWSVQLHYENLVVLAAEQSLGAVPSYATVLRYMRDRGLRRVKRAPRPTTPGAELALRRLETREVRSYEATHVHALWHADFHEGSRHVLLPTAQWVEVQLFGALDDLSRLGCHLQWYLAESAECFVHGLSQAFQKRGLPRELMTDGGSAMKAGETQQGLEDLSVLHTPTLPKSPYQNGKIEAFWDSVENRLLPMLDGVEELTLPLLNEATQAWMEQGYNRHPHDELGGQTPLARYLAGPDVGRPCPSSAALRDAFRLRVWRHQRRSDGTVSLEGRRFEVPSRFRTQRRLRLRYARWDLSYVDIVDPRTDKVLAPLYPQDKTSNADGRRRTLHPLPDAIEPVPRRSGEIAPLLKKLMADYAATGLPPAYLPHDHGAGGDDDRRDETQIPDEEDE